LRHHTLKQAPPPKQPQKKLECQSVRNASGISQMVSILVNV